MATISSKDKYNLPLNVGDTVELPHHHAKGTVESITTQSGIDFITVTTTITAVANDAIVLDRPIHTQEEA